MHCLTVTQSVSSTFCFCTFPLLTYQSQGDKGKVEAAGKFPLKEKYNILTYRNIQLLQEPF